MLTMSPPKTRVNATTSKNAPGGFSKQMDEKEIIFESKDSCGSEVSIERLEDLDVALPALCNSLYDALGAKNLEATYQRALVVDLENTGIRDIQAERSIRIMYKGQCVGTRRADLILHTSNGQAVVELKAVAKLTSEHIKQLEYYMVHFDIAVGYLINFPHESGFSSVDSLDFAFQQTHISGPSALNHPISDATMRRRAGVGVSDDASPHIIKLTKVHAHKPLPLPLTTPQLTTPPRGKSDPPPVTLSAADTIASPRATFGVAKSTGKPCKICIQENKYCSYHENQDPNRK